MAKGELSMDFLSNTQTAKATLISELNLSMACSSSAKQLECPMKILNIPAQIKSKIDSVSLVKDG
ncbi:hypothetical protein EJB05_10923, partial [Eragrostis curvula]